VAQRVFDIPRGSGATAAASLGRRPAVLVISLILGISNTSAGSPGTVGLAHGTVHEDRSSRLS
jgi:hypothetical protein